MSFSGGQKLNAWISTIVELIEVDNDIPNILWGKYFIECHGYTVTSNILYQDN